MEEITKYAKRIPALKSDYAGKRGGFLTAVRSVTTIMIISSKVGEESCLLIYQYCRTVDRDPLLYPDPALGR